jgi:hypothetical protein
MTAPIELYPFATRDGKAIPLDIIRPRGFIKKNFTTVSASLSLPRDSYVATFTSDVDCLISFGADLPTNLVDGVDYVDTLCVPAGVTVTAAVVTSDAHVKGLTSSGSLLIQLIEKWAGLALDSQFRIK